NQRDQLVAELAEHVDIRASVQDEGSYNISIGNGQPLVSGNHQFDLTTMRSSSDPTRTVVGYRDSAGNLIELDDSTFSGGTLGGLMPFRNETLEPICNRLGQLAVSFAGAINAVHRDGVDYDGARGGDMFSVGSPRLYANARNDGNATLTVAFDDAAMDELAGADY